MALVAATVLFAMASLLAGPASGATRTWSGLGATNNWNDAGNWVGGLIPGAADVATFDATGAKNATINLNINVGGINVTAAYTGAITQAAGSTVTVGASGFSLAGGASLPSFTGGNSAITVNGPFSLNGGTFSTTSGTLSVSGAFTDATAGTFSAGSGTVALIGGAATIDVPGNETFNNLTHTAGVKTISAGDTLTVSGTTILTAGSLNGTGTLAARGAISQAAGYGGGTATLLIDGGGAQTLTASSTTGAGSLPVLVIDKPSGTLTLAVTAGAFIRTTNNWTYTGGTLDPGSTTVVFAGGTVSGSHTLNNVDLRATTAVAAGTTLTVTGTTALTVGALNGTGTLAARGAINQAVGSTGGTGTLLIDGTGAQTFTGTATTAAGALPALVINKPSGTLTLAGTIRTANSWTYSGGTLDPGSSTVVFAGGTVSGSHTLNNVEIRGAVSVPAGTSLSLAGSYTMPSAVVLTLNGSITVAGTTVLTDGTINGAGALHAQADLSQASTFDGGTGTLLIDGTGAQTFTGTATTAAGALPALVINKPSGTLTLAGTIRTANSWTYSGGTLDPGSSTVVFAGGTVSGSHTLNNVEIRGAVSVPAGTSLSLAGSYTMPSAVVLTLNGSITVAGTTVLTDGTINGAGALHAQADLSQASTFDGGTGTLLLDGTGAQTFTGTATTAAGALPALVINKPSGTLTLAGTIRTANSWTYSGGTLDPGSSTVVFAGGTVSGSHTLNNVEIRGAVSVPAGTSLSLAGSYTMPSAVVLTLNGSITVAGTTVLTDGTINGAGALHAQADLSQASTFDGGTGTLLLDGTGAQTFTGTATTAAGALPALVINKPSGTLTLAGTIRTANSWTYTAGTLDPGSSTVVFAGTLTIAGSQTLNNVVFNGAGTTYTVPAQLTVGGALTLTDGLIAGGTVAARGNLSQASTFDGGTGTLLIDGTGAQTFTGTATTAAGALPALVINKPSGTLTLAGTIRTGNSWTYSAGTLDPGSSTVVFAGGTVSGSHTLNNVEIRGAVSVPAGTSLSLAGSYTMPSAVVLTLNGSITVAGTTVLTDGTINGAGALHAQADLSQASTFDGGTGTLLLDGTGAQTFTGTATTAAGALPALVINKPSGTLTLAGTIRTANSWTYTAGTLDPGSSTVVFAGNATVTSAGMTFHDVIVNGGTRTLGSSLTLDRDLTILSGTLTTAAASYPITVARDLTITGTLTANASLISVGGNLAKTGTFTAGTSTVTLNGTGGQAMSGTAWTMRNLVIADAAGATMATNVSVTGILTLTSGPFAIAANTLTIANPIAGVPTLLTAGPTSSLSIVSAVAGISIPSSVTQLLNLTVNDAAGISQAATLTVNGTLTLTSGRIVTGGSTLVIAPGGTVVRTAGWVAGNLRKTAPTGSSVALAFEIGDLASYTPVSVTFGTVSAAGTLTASTTPGEHPDVVNAGVDPAQDVNRYWTIIDGGIAFDVYSATFTFVATDVDAGANPLGFVVAKDDGGTWTVPTVGARTAITTQATGMTTFSDFVLGEPEADLSLTKTDGVAIVAAGDGVTHTYVMTVTDDGPSDATGVVLTDTWPTGFSQGAISASQGSCAPIGSGPDLSCALGTIAAGAQATVSIAFTVPSDLAGGPRTNSATVAGDLLDPDPTDDTATDTDMVIEVADLVVTKTDGETSVLAGSVGHAYTVTVTNDGPSDADTVALTDAVPVQLSAGIPTADLGGDCTASSGNAVSCALPASLPAGATWTLTIPYSVAPSATPGTVVNVATAMSDEQPSGVQASDPTDIVGQADLRVAKGDGVAIVAAGDGVTHTYVMTVTDDGPSDATGVVLTDTWPTGFIQGAISASQGSCAPIGSGPDLSCALGTIAAGAQATVSIAFTVPSDLAGGPRTNSATVAGDLLDPDPTDDTATDTDMVIEVADLVVTKTDGETSVLAGSVGHAYTVTVTNDGPSDADTVALTDAVPVQLSAGIPTADLGGDCTASSGNAVSCALPASLPAGATWTLTIPYSVAPSATPGTVVNVATAMSDEQPSGVQASDPTDIVGQADLRVAKGDGVAIVAAGDGVTHTYVMTVTDDGPSDATGVVLTDTWPTGFSQGAISASQGSCAPIGSGPDLSCALGTIAAGAQATVSIAFTVPSDLAGGPRTNSATVAGDLLDPDPTDDTATDTDMVTVAAPSGPPSSQPGGGVAPDTSAAGDLPAPLDLIRPVLAPAGLLILLAIILFSVSAWEVRRRGSDRRAP